MTVAPTRGQIANLFFMQQVKQRLGISMKDVVADSKKRVFGDCAPLLDTYRTMWLFNDCMRYLMNDYRLYDLFEFTAFSLMIKHHLIHKVFSYIENIESREVRQERESEVIQKIDNCFRELIINHGGNNVGFRTGKDGVINRFSFVFFNDCVELDYLPFDFLQAVEEMLNVLTNYERSFYGKKEVV